MGYFRELPNIVYQSPLNHKNSSTDYIVIKNLFRGAKLKSYLDGSVTALDKYVINDGDRPDTIAEFLYGDAALDYVIILVAGITNINHEWPLQDYQIYDYALDKYGSETEMNKIHHYETFESFSLPGPNTNKSILLIKFDRPPGEQKYFPPAGHFNPVISADTIAHVRGQMGYDLEVYGPDDTFTEEKQ